MHTTTKLCTNKVHKQVCAKNIKFYVVGPKHPKKRPISYLPDIDMPANESLAQAQK